jgi:hypothetical protein
LIFLDSTVRQSTGFDRSASSNGIKSQFLGIFGANCHAGAKLQSRRSAKIKIRQQKFAIDFSVIFFIAEDKRDKRKKPAETSLGWEVQTAPGSIFLVLRYELRYH